VWVPFLITFAAKIPPERRMADEGDNRPRSRFGRRAMGLLKKALPRDEEPEQAKAGKTVDDDFLSLALERAQEAYNRDRENIDAAYDDLAFKAGSQWPEWALRQRENQKRPILTFNRIPQFTRQVTGDLRLMRPSIKATPADGLARKEIAELISGMLRY